MVKRNCGDNEFEMERKSKGRGSVLVCPRGKKGLDFRFHSNEILIQRDQRRKTDDVLFG